MHLAHTIPWHGISKHLEFVKDNKAWYGHPSDMFATCGEHQTSDVLHFVRVFADCINEFSLTERKKFPVKMDFQAPLFSDDLLDEKKFHLNPYSTNDNRSIPLDKDMQSTDFWVKEAAEGFSTAHGDLADAVKFLIQQHQSHALLTLSQAVPLSRLFNLSWGHGFGVYLLAYQSFRMYVLLNLAYSLQQRQLTPGKKGFRIFDMDGLRREVVECFTNCDYSTQFIRHRQFWEKYVQNPTYDGTGTTFQDPAEVNMADLKEYLAGCFRDIYLYDMICRECGDKNMRKFWINDITLTLNFMFSSLKLPEPELLEP